MRWLLMLVICALGCGAESRRTMPSVEYAPEMAEADLGGSQSAPAGTGAAATPADASQAMPSQAALKRKIIYTAQVDLDVKNFEPIPDGVEDLVKQFDGFVARSNVSGSPGSSRRGQWTIRVPVDRYDGFVAELRNRLGGEVQRVTVDSKDVTEEYFDVEARIRNKKRTEERLIELVDTHNGKLEDLLTVERELSRVREEVERVEGRLRVLSEQTSLATITLTVTEVQDYVPEEPPGYKKRVREAFRASVAALVTVAQELSIAIVAIAPWIGVLLVLALPVILVWRIVRRYRRTKLVQPEVVAQSPFEG